MNDSDIKWFEVRTKRTLAIIILGIYLAMCFIAALYPLFNKSDKDIDDFANYFSKVSNGFSTVIGVIIGYYFAKNENSRPNSNSAEREPII